MDKLDAEIESPCREDWEAMAVDSGGRRRFCGSCSEHVHDLSEMTRGEAELFLAALGDAPACIAFALDDQGQIEHRKAMPPAAVLVPVTRLRRLASHKSRRIAPALLASALAACAPHGENERMPELESAVATQPAPVIVPIAVPSVDPPAHEMDDLLGERLADPLADEPCETLVESPKARTLGKRKKKRKGMRVQRDNGLGEL